MATFHEYYGKLTEVKKKYLKKIKAILSQVHKSMHLKEITSNTSRESDSRTAV
ncbi:hypothetical protein C8J95_11152 [Elizabethkingia sp. YR214]|nr:hypothetical protein C8J95_11152 [Elizabethkingia sp. YR214]